MIQHIEIDKSKKEKPIINLTVTRVEANVWNDLGFEKYHYLTPTLNKSCKCLLFMWNDIPVAFVALLNTPRKGVRFGHAISRIVILPDFQGLGLSTYLLNFCGGILKSLSDKHFLYIKTIHDKMGEALERNTNWTPTSYNGKIRNENAITAEGERYKNRLARKSYCFKYIGGAIYGYEKLLLPINELREKKKTNKQLTLDLS